MKELTAFQRDLLYTISSYEKPYGLKIKRNLEQYYEDDINNGQLYPNLDDLADAGLIEKGKSDARTNTYQLTREGLRELRHRREWENKHVPRGMVSN